MSTFRKPAMMMALAGAATILTAGFAMPLDALACDERGRLGGVESSARQPGDRLEQAVEPQFCFTVKNTTDLKLLVKGWHPGELDAGTTVIVPPGKSATLEVKGSHANVEAGGQEPVMHFRITELPESGWEDPDSRYVINLTLRHNALPEIEDDPRSLLRGRLIVQTGDEIGVVEVESERAIEEVPEIDDHPPLPLIKNDNNEQDPSPIRSMCSSAWGVICRWE